MTDPIHDLNTETLNAWNAGFEEGAFPPDIHQTTPLGWGGNFSEIPAVIVARLRLKT